MEKTRKKIKVLIVDDEPGWRDLLSLELSSEDCEVTTASNALAALDLLHRQSFDLLITDIRMPGQLDGADLIQVWHRENPAQKVIFITGYAIEEKIRQVMEQSSILCLKKPFESRELLNAVQTLLAS
ncbi:MAG: response regulator [Candidatus Omnitrophica bacterium]|nr:response regulator [Candidatus Omnitrophota bacterium]